MSVARRRDHEAEARAAFTGVPPVELESMAGVAAFVDELEPVPSWWEDDAATWRHLSAYGRWSNARKQWAADNGVDYVDTFYPHWRRHGTPPQA